MLRLNLIYFSIIWIGKMKIGIIGGSYFSKLFCQFGVDSISPYGNSYFRKFILLGRKIFPRFMWGMEYKRNWFDKYKNYDVIIVFDCSFTTGDEYELNYILNKASDKTRLIYYHWNIVDTNISIKNTFNIPRWEHCTFDFNDSKKYNMHFVDTFYVDIYEHKNQAIIKRDLFYIGIDKKERRAFVNKLKDYCESINLNSMFYIVDSVLFGNTKISYNKVIEYVKSSKCIVEIQKPSQTGLTLRALESLFFKKKLITNNQSIVNYKFFNQNNILIVNENNFEEINYFLDKPYVNIDDSIIENYKFDSWLRKVLITKDNL